MGGRDICRIKLRSCYAGMCRRGPFCFPAWFLSFSIVKIVLFYLCTFLVVHFCRGCDVLWLFCFLLFCLNVWRSNLLPPGCICNLESWFLEFVMFFGWSLIRISNSSWLFFQIQPLSGEDWRKDRVRADVFRPLDLWWCYVLISARSRSVICLFSFFFCCAFIIILMCCSWVRFLFPNSENSDLCFT